MIKWRCSLIASLLFTAWGGQVQAEESSGDKEEPGRDLYLHSSGGVAFLPNTGAEVDGLGYSFRVSVGPGFGFFEEQSTGKGGAERFTLKNEMGFGVTGSLMSIDIGGTVPLFVTQLGGELYSMTPLNRQVGLRLSTSLGVVTTNSVPRAQDPKCEEKKHLVESSVGFGWSGGVEFVLPLQWQKARLSLGALPILTKSRTSFFVVVPIHVGLSF